MAIVCSLVVLAPLPGWQQQLLSDFFVQPPWPERHPQRLALAHDLPTDSLRLALTIDRLVERLCLQHLVASYSGRGNRPHRPDLLLKAVLFLTQRGKHHPADWFFQAHENRVVQWLLRGLRPSRARWYAFRDRLAPWLDELNKQLLDQAHRLGLLTVQVPVLDGTLLAANSTRHKLLNQPTLQRRLQQLQQALAADQVNAAAAPLADPANPLAAPLADPANPLAAPLADPANPLAAPLADPANSLAAPLADPANSLAAPLADLANPLAAPLADLANSLAAPLAATATPPAAAAAADPVQQAVAPSAEHSATPAPAATLSPTPSEQTPTLAAEPLPPTPATEPALTPTPTPLPQPARPAGSSRGPWPAWMAQTADGRQQQQERYQKVDQQLQQRLQHNARRRKEDRKPPEQVRISPGDPEASLGLDKERVYRPLYNGQVACDLDSDFCLGYGVFSGVQDGATLLPMVERLKYFLPWLAFDWLLTDAGYANGANLRALEKDDILLLAPWQENDYSRKQQAKQIPKSQFTWDAQQQTYICPEGHGLRYLRTQTKRLADREEQHQQYRCPPEHCQACPRQGECTSNPQAGRMVVRNEYEEEVQRLRSRMETEAAQQLYRKRKEQIERRLADSKQHRQLRRLSKRGLAGAQLQLGLIVLANNMVVFDKLASAAQDANAAAFAG